MEQKTPNFNHLFYFYVTAQLKSVSGAARQIGISQPALSMQLKALEKNVGSALYERHRNAIALTSVGRQLFSYCRTMFEKVSDIESMLSGGTQVAKNPIRVGVSLDIERPFAASLVVDAAKKQRRPQQLRALSMRHSELMQLVALRELDVFLTCQPVVIVGAEVVHTLRIPVDFVAHKDLLKRYVEIGSDVATPPRNLIKHLLQREFPVGLPVESLILRHEAEVFLGNTRMTANIVFESDAITAMLSAVVSGFVGCFVPRHYVEFSKAFKDVVRIGPAQGFWTHSIHIGVSKHGQGLDLVRCMKQRLEHIGEVF